MCIKINWITQNYNEWCCHNCIRGLCDINTANTKNRSVSQTLIWSDTIICIRQSSWQQKVLLNDWKSQSYLTKVEILERRGEKSDFGSRRHLRWLSVCKGKDAKSKFERHQLQCREWKCGCTYSWSSNHPSPASILCREQARPFCIRPLERVDNFFLKKVSILCRDQGRPLCIRPKHKIHKSINNKK